MHYFTHVGNQLNNSINKKFVLILNANIRSLNIVSTVVNDINMKIVRLNILHALFKIECLHNIEINFSVPKVFEKKSIYLVTYNKICFL